MLHFIPVPEEAFEEMQRVARKGGAVAVYVWYYAGKLEFIYHFQDTDVVLYPGASGFHESHRLQDAYAEQLIDIFSCIGFSQVEAAPLM